MDNNKDAAAADTEIYPHATRPIDEIRPRTRRDVNSFCLLPWKPSPQPLAPCPHPAVTPATVASPPSPAFKQR